MKQTCVKSSWVIGIALFAAALMPATGSAQTYGSQTGFGQNDDANALIRELNTLLEKGEKERLIDPWFLRDIRTVISRYDRPWSSILLSDDFSARGPQPDAPWQVTAGEFLIDWRHGLRSVIESRQVSQSTSTSSNSGKQDAAQAILGALLQGALKGNSSNNQNSGSQQQTSTQSSFAAVQAALPISNAFSIDTTFSLRPIANNAEEGFELGPYQGATGSVGYRLSYVAQDRSLQLLKVSSRGVSTIDVVRLSAPLTDSQNHQLTWTRDREGNMAIALDGQEIIAVTDRSFRDAFNGFAVLNRGGDIALREVTIAGIPN